MVDSGGFSGACEKLVHLCLKKYERVYEYKWLNFVYVKLRGCIQKNKGAQTMNIDGGHKFASTYGCLDYYYYYIYT